MASPPSLFLPVEIKHRELYAKILLATMAARRGFHVVIGRKSEVNTLVMRVPPGVYYGLGTVRNFESFFAALRARGNRVVVSDEEGLVTHSDELYLDFKVSQATLDVLDLVFTWGAENHGVLAAGRPAAAGKLRITGNPRFDLLHPPYAGIYEHDIEAIRARYSKYVMVCTSFASCNHFIPDLDYVQALIEKKVLSSDESIAAYRRFQQVKAAAWQAFLSAIPQLARAYPETSFVIRPHPSENPDPYRSFEQDCGNVFVDDRFSIHPWILGADAVVHHYCTSAVEACAAGTPSFALRPTRDPAVEKEIPYECSTVCESADELVEAIGPTLRAVRRERTAVPPGYVRYVRNIDAPVAATLIVEQLCALAASTDVSSIAVRPLDHRKRVASVVREVLFPFVPWSRASRRYVSRKFDRLTPTEVQRAIHILAPADARRFSCERYDANVVRIRYTHPD